MSNDPFMGTTNICVIGMPYVFNYTCGNHAFRRNMDCERCTGRTTSGQRCSRTVCIGLPLCWQHAKKVYGVRVGNSTLHGKGVFATISFSRGDWICPYNGEVVTRAQLDTRYPGDCLAPYGMCEDNRCEDGASRRGLGTIANGEGPRGRRIRTNAKTVKFARNYPISEHRRTRLEQYGVLPVHGSMWLIATRDIPQGTEIIQNYGEEYWEDGPITTHSTKYR